MKLYIISFLLERTLILERIDYNPNFWNISSVNNYTVSINSENSGCFISIQIWVKNTFCKSLYCLLYLSTIFWCLPHNIIQFWKIILIIRTEIISVFLQCFFESAILRGVSYRVHTLLSHFYKLASLKYNILGHSSRPAKNISGMPSEWENITMVIWS